MIAPYNGMNMCNANEIFSFLNFSDFVCASWNSVFEPVGLAKGISIAFSSWEVEVGIA